jgi:AcrR family transcriptional regulator
MVISQRNSAVKGPAGGVRERLLDAAEELFAERGFDGTSIRDLAAAARCNIASVNYYFGGKEKLYVEIWRRHLLLLRDTRIAIIDEVMSMSGGKPRLEDLLRSFAYAFIGPLIDESGGARHDVIKPTLSAMQQALAKACPELPKSKVPLVVFSLVGQLIHTIRIKSMLQSTDDEAFAMFELAKVIDHIVAFSVAGIRAFAGGETE